MQLFHFLLVVVSLSCGSLPATEIDPRMGTLATLAVVAAWWILCEAAARVVAGQVVRDAIDPVLGARCLEKQLEAFRWLSLGVVGLCLGGFGVAASLDTVAVLENSMFLQAIILLAPGIVMTMASWSAEHHYGTRLGYTKKGLFNYGRSMFMAFRSGLAWLLIPIVLLMGLVDVVGLLPTGSEVGGAVAIGAAVIVTLMALPRLIPYLLRTSSIDGDTDAWIHNVLAAVNIKGIHAVRWETEGRAFNAMVAGFVRPLRTLLVSDRLLDELPKEQIAMVLLHEAAHLRRRHVPLRMLAVIPAWITGALVTQIAGDHSYAAILGGAAGILMTLLVLRIVAYRTEFDADVQACKLAQQVSVVCPHVPGNYEAAADALTAALMRVTFDNPAVRRASWLHPGVADRVAWMRRQRATPISNTSSAGTIANPA